MVSEFFAAYRWFYLYLSSLPAQGVLIAAEANPKDPESATQVTVPLSGTVKAAVPKGLAISTGEAADSSSEVATELNLKGPASATQVSIHSSKAAAGAIPKSSTIPAGEAADFSGEAAAEVMPKGLVIPVIETAFFSGRMTAGTATEDSIKAEG